jgi:deoxyribose-phosphate aldolase
MIDNFVATIQADSQATGHAKNHDNNHENVIVSATSFGLASFIDHTLLKADATAAEIERICLEARKYEFAAVCVNSSFIPLVTKLLAGSKTIPISVVGFPLGAASTESKAFEARKAVQDGACEIDMVIHVGELKNREYENVLEDIRAVVEASKPWPVKVILETCLLNDEQKIAACALAKTAGAAFVKTSTGFGSGGATIADIRLMRRAVGPEMGVKASGGIRTREDAIQMIKAGANRIGASAGVAMVSSGTDTANLSTHLNHTNANKGSY